jgi:hypothetical protein
LIENQVNRSWQHGRPEAALSASAAFVIQAFRNLRFGYLMIRRFGLIMVMISCLMMVRVLDRFLGNRRNRTATVTEHLGDRSHALQWDCKSKQAHH